jgi:hypothetical protein
MSTPMPEGASSLARSFTVQTYYDALGVETIFQITPSAASGGPPQVASSITGVANLLKVILTNAPNAG